MAYRLIRPTSAPYNLTGPRLAAFCNWYGIVDPLPTADLGSLADDSDATYTTLYSRSNGLLYDSTVVAVDFGPLPGTADSSLNFGAMVRLTNVLMETIGSVTWQNTTWAVFDSTWTSGAPNLAGGASIEDIADLFLEDLPTTTTSYTTADNEFSWNADDSELSAAYADGFTVAMAVRINSAGSTPGLVIQEFGLRVNVASRRPPLRRFPVENGAHGPRRLYPPPKDRRIAGGYH